MKTWKIIFFAFLCILFLAKVSTPAFAGGPSMGEDDDFRQNHGSTEISLKSDFARPVIQRISKDMEVAPNTEFTLEAEVSEKALSKIQWSLSRDGGKSYSDVGSGSLKLTTKLPTNDPDTLPYIFRLRIENVGGTDEAFIRVIVSSTMKYEYKTLEEGGVTVEGLIYKGITSSALVVIKEQPSRYPDLEALVTGDKVPLVAYEVHIMDITGRYLPYIGTLEITFPVGGVFDSQILRVYHKKSKKQIETLDGGVQSGKLKVSTDSLSPFLIEVPHSLVQKVVVTVRGPGTVAPDGTVYIARYESQSFVMTGEAGYAVKEVKLDGQPVSYSGNTYTQSNITQDHNLEVIFARPSTGGGGGGSGGGGGGGSGGGSGSVPGDEGGGPGSVPGHEGGGGPGSHSESVPENIPGSVPGNASGIPGGGQNNAQNGVFYQISVKVKGKGTVSPDQTVSVRQGESQTFYFYPHRGYRVGQVLVNGVKMTVLGSSYTFTAVTGNAELEVIFEQQTGALRRGEHTITATAGEGGTISPEGVNTVRYGGDLYVYFKPDEGYRVFKVTVDGKKTETGDSYHFINVTADRRIHVEFEKNNKTAPEVKTKRYEVKIGVRGGKGTVSPQGNIWVNEGGSQTIYFYPSDGYEVSGITVNGKAVSWTAESYTLENIRDNMEVEVTFASGISTALHSGCPICALFGIKCFWPVCWLILLLILALLLFIGRRIYVICLKKKNDEEEDQKESKD